VLSKPSLLFLNTPYAVVVTLAHAYAPFAILPIFVALQTIPGSLLEAASDLGARPARTFLRVVLPLARRGLIAGVVLAFARALGEFGATLILAGNIPGRTQTLPLAIYEAVMTGEDDTALLLSLVLTTVSVVVILLANRLGRRVS